MFFPKLRQNAVTRKGIQRFLGYDRNPRGAEGAFWDMKNLSSAHFPLLGPRAPRGVVARLEDPQGLGCSQTAAWVDRGKLYWNGLEVEGLVLSTLPAMCPKELVFMGAYLVIFPDRVYFNTADPSDWGSLDNCRTVVCSQESGIRYSLCRADGTTYESYSLSDTAPQEPEDGSLWLNTAQEQHTLLTYSAPGGMWVPVAATYVKLEGSGIGLGFSQYDGVELAGCGPESLNGSAVLEQAEENALVVAGMLDQPLTQSSGTVTVSRRAPDMDFVAQCGNRLWGCKYGLVEGKTVNEIYASALGDFKNWSRFQGLSTDSYRASRGSDGPWTGAITYLGRPVFFKENAIETVWPDASGAHSIVTTNCRGVQKGSHRSLVIVDEILYYKSPTDVCAYDGSLPVTVSGALGSEAYGNAVAGRQGARYYISMEGEQGRSLFVYDTARGLWHREDGLQVRFFATRGQELLAIDMGGRLLSMTGASGEPEGPVDWMAQTGPMDLSTPDQFYVTRLTLRLQVPSGSLVRAELRYDSTGPWEQVASLRGDRLQSRTVPIVPRRCDHVELRLSGQGPCRLYSLVKTMEEGSDVVWPLG